MPERQEQDRNNQKHDHKQNQRPEPRHEHRHEQRQEHRHEQRYEHRQEPAHRQERRFEIPHAQYPTPPQFRYPQNFHPTPQQQQQHNHFDYRNQGDFRRYQQQHFRNPYDGMNNFWRDSWQDNYYYDGRGHHHHHHRQKDDFFPRLLEGIVGGLLNGTLVKELDKLDFDKKPETKQKAQIEDLDDNDMDNKQIRKEMLTPDQQILLNLDMQSKWQDLDADRRFERTG